MPERISYAARYCREPSARPLSSCAALRSPYPTPLQAAAVPAPPFEHWSELLDSAQSMSTSAAPHAGRRLRVLRDLLLALRRWLWALGVAVPPRQGHAIAGRQRLETERALPLKDAGTGRWELGAGLPHARRRGSDFSGSDFRSLTVRGRAALAEELLPVAGGCATRAHRHARGCLAPRHLCWDRAPHRPADHAALPRTCAGRLAKWLQARLPSSRADPGRAARRANLLGLHCAVHPAQRLL
jgi:hypothetical protein